MLLGHLKDSRTKILLAQHRQFTNSSGNLLATHHLRNTAFARDPGKLSTRRTHKADLKAPVTRLATQDSSICPNVPLICYQSLGARRLTAQKEGGQKQSVGKTHIMALSKLLQNTHTDFGIMLVVAGRHRLLGCKWPKRALHVLQFGAT